MCRAVPCLKKTPGSGAEPRVKIGNQNFDSDPTKTVGHAMRGANRLVLQVATGEPRGTSKNRANGVSLESEAADFQVKIRKINCLFNATDIHFGSSSGQFLTKKC